MVKRILLEDVLKEHAALDISYQAAISHFKPQIANDRHIAIRDAVEHVNDLAHKAQLIITAQQGGATALTDVIRAKRHVLELLETA